MADGEATAASRVTAARATLELTLKIDEHRDLVERVERLETRLGKGKGNGVC
jgi:ribosomal protein L16/L10AE